ncbi:YbhB/YbcL family Raf kinase inhibitor-like protein [Sinosporangium siamense]|uniref:YbhB/YbcL family Raf kinase inhibitor-like protein n=1 Tax=Sinosporangium siamense TaxID=1367973 RepID=A0A919RPP5_9ACTN|nr:YbhB/YbcL family Raf kinase inhibitor-like protein [Sinosporangium siamense]GII97573.1 hypothetical protein Ssi02_78040 [Sinosporangium siamense]
MGQPTTFSPARRAAFVAAVTALGVGLSGCGILGKSNSDTVTMPEFVVSSPQIRNGGSLPAGYSCSGNQGNPPIRWSRVPPETKSIAIVVDDSAVESSQVHWVLYDIDPGTTEVPENITESPPEGVTQAHNSRGTPTYQPPCNPQGTYRFSVYALRKKVVDGSESAPLALDDALKRIASQTIARGRLTAVNIASPGEHRR